MRKVLGNPDEIWKVAVPEDLDPAVIRSEEIWRYGVDRPNGLATLGQVHFDKHWATLIGGRVAPPPKKVISETKLRAGMSFLYDASSIGADPLQLIRCVNTLRPLGKNGVLAVFEHFSNLTDFELWQDWLIYLLRVLFDPPHPPSYLPWAEGYPRYPMVVIDDVPMHVFVPGGGTGQSARVDDELPFYRKTGSLRSKNLRPPDDPFDVVQKLIDASPWSDPLARERARSFSPRWSEQVLRLVRTAHRPKRIYGFPGGEGLEGHRAEFKALKSRWSERHQVYVRGDGSFEPLPKHEFEYPDAKRTK